MIDNSTAVGIMANMDAVLIYRQKELIADTYVMESVIWRVPTPVSGSRHLYKYRLYFGTVGRRIVGYDNERGKGDHWHLDGEERPYAFASISQLQLDFESEVQSWLRTHDAP